MSATDAIFVTPFVEAKVIDEVDEANISRVRALGAEFIAALHDIGGTDPEGQRLASRHLSLAQTHIEDATMRAVRHIYGA